MTRKGEKKEKERKKGERRETRKEEEKMKTSGRRKINRGKRQQGEEKGKGSKNGSSGTRAKLVRSRAVARTPPPRRSHLPGGDSKTKGSLPVHLICSLI